MSMYMYGHMFADECWCFLKNGVEGLNLELQEFARKFPEESGARNYLDKIRFVEVNENLYSSPAETQTEWDYWLNSWATLELPGVNKPHEVLLPADLNQFPLEFDEDCDPDQREDIPGPFKTDKELEEYIMGWIDLGEFVDKFGQFCIKLIGEDGKLQSKYDNVIGLDLDNHPGFDELLYFLAMHNVTNAYGNPWKCTYLARDEYGFGRTMEFDLENINLEKENCEAG